ncbi:MAG: UDP-N-acetylmuramate dehydrogenase [Aquificota bacterium]|nr:UDP-N-acetylmuramate dehydrogenase [Aquificota bacterium]
MERIKGADLSKLTTLKVGGRADLLVIPNKVEDVRESVLLSREKDVPLFILGGGSNTVFGDVKGIVLWLRRLRGMKVVSSAEGFLVEVMAGTPLSDLVILSVRENLEGIWRLTGFPATVGGAVSMNAGAFGAEMKDFLTSVTFMDWEGNVHRVRAEEIEFSYRRSPFPGIGIVLSCELFLKRSELPVREEITKIRTLRKRTQPVNLPTSGSTFKNPYPRHAGDLLERVGMKGYRSGDIAFSNIHANFLVNLGEGRFEDVVRIIEEAKRRVLEEFGIVLEEEVRIVEDSGSDGWKVL